MTSFADMIDIFCSPSTWMTSSSTPTIWNNISAHIREGPPLPMQEPFSMPRADKCEFPLQLLTKYLGYIAVSPMASQWPRIKFQAIQDWPGTLENLGHHGCSSGFANFYQRFQFMGYSEITVPLMRLTLKRLSPGTFSDDCWKSFKKTQEVFHHSPGAHPLDPGHPNSW